MRLDFRLRRTVSPPLSSHADARRASRGLSARAVWALAALVLGALAAPVAASEPVDLASGGEAQLPIVVSDEADEVVRAAAVDLADYLERISGATFEVEVGDGRAGLVLGLPEDFDRLPVQQRFSDEPFERDRYRIVSTGEALYLLGATPQAVEFAVWDLLHRFGYRRFFPPETWEVVPEHDELRIDVDAYEAPSYYSRRGPRGAMRYAHRPWAQEGWEAWQTRNRTRPSFELNTGHAYLGLFRRNQEAFEANPEFYALVDGEREHIGSTTKICIGNEALRELVVEDSIRRIEANPELDSISLDPSDGSNWCDEACELCAPLGSVSDRVVMLSNQVAEALEAEFDRTYYVGIYAYNDYSPAPSIEVHPNVIVSLATAFIRGDQTFDDMLEGWSRKTQRIGIREYYGVPAWNSSMPGQARAARLDYMRRTVPEFREKGARFMNAESDDAWGPNGLGYYLAARMLWDTDEAGRADELIDDFVEKSFGPAREPMREYYELITDQPRTSEHLVGTMYRLLDEARQLAEEPAQRERIDDLILYTRYVELHRHFTRVDEEGKQDAFDEVVSFVWRTRERMMVDSLGVLDYMNRQQRGSDHYGWGEGYNRVQPAHDQRQRENEPHSESEILAILERGIAENETLDFDPVGFSHRLAPVDRLELPEADALGRGNRTRGRVVNYTWIREPGRPIVLEMRTGLIYDNRGPARVALEWWNEDTDAFEVIDTGEVPPDQEPHRVELGAERPGLHRIVWEERMAGTETTWPEHLPRTTPSTMEHANHMWGRDSWHFYVPRGTQVIGAYASARAGGIHDAEGEQVFDFDETGSYNDYLTIEVPEGQDGRLWSVRRLAGDVRLLTVPPFGASSPDDLLLPREALEQERTRQ